MNSHIPITITAIVSKSIKIIISLENKFGKLRNKF